MLYDSGNSNQGSVTTSRGGRWREIKHKQKRRRIKLIKTNEEKMLSAKNRVISSEMFYIKLMGTTKHKS